MSELSSDLAVALEPPELSPEMVAEVEWRFGMLREDMHNKTECYLRDLRRGDDVSLLLAKVAEVARKHGDTLPPEIEAWLDGHSAKAEA